MEEQEPPLESVIENVHEHAHHAPERWVLGVALSTAILAALAAVASLLSGGHADEAVIDQQKASDQWAYYQAKGIKAKVLSTKLELLAAMGKEVSLEDKKQVADYGDEQKEVKKEAEEKEKSSSHHLASHETLSKGVTMFQIAIAVSAISVLTKRRAFWFLGLMFGLVGIALLFHGGVLQQMAGMSG